MAKIKNPLVKRLPREFKSDWKKYLILFVFVVSIIAFVSGMFVANRSMLIAAEEGIVKYKREDGRIEFENEASEELIAGIESGKVADVKSFISNKAQEEFDKEFNKEFGDKFWLMKTEEVLEQKMLGTAKERDDLRSYLGNYIAVATGDLSIYFTDADYRSMHAGLTEDEMLIPLIVFN